MQHMSSHIGGEEFFGPMGLSLHQGLGLRHENRSDINVASLFPCILVVLPQENTPSCFEISKFQAWIQS